MSADTQRIVVEERVANTCRQLSFALDIARGEIHTYINIRTYILSVTCNKPNISAYTNTRRQRSAVITATITSKISHTDSC